MSTLASIVAQRAIELGSGEFHSLTGSISMKVVMEPSAFVFRVHGFEQTKHLRVEIVNTIPVISECYDEQDVLCILGLLISYMVQIA